MGIVKITDQLHEQLRLASAAMDRSINAQAEFWIKIGLLAELNPNLPYNELINKLLLDKPDLIRGAQLMIKTAKQLAVMRESGRLLAQVFTMLDSFVVAGRSTLELDSAVEAFIRNDLKARPASLGQYDYPFSINTSINEVVCHGMPSAKEILKDGDIINIDITLEKGGFIADSSKMYLIGNVAPKARRLVKMTFEAMWAGIRQVKPGARLGDIGHAIQSHAQANGYSVVREYCGHGIGRQMHEEPQILHFGRPGTGLELREGMVFTVEPMLNQGSAKVRGLKDGWTVVTKDNSLSAQWEHTVAVTAEGFEVLTLQNQPGE